MFFGCCLTHKQKLLICRNGQKLHKNNTHKKQILFLWSWSRLFFRPDAWLWVCVFICVCVCVCAWVDLISKIENKHTHRTFSRSLDVVFCVCVCVKRKQLFWLLWLSMYSPQLSLRMCVCVYVCTFVCTCVSEDNWGYLLIKGKSIVKINKKTKGVTLQQINKLFFKKENNLLPLRKLLVKRQQ